MSIKMPVSLTSDFSPLQSPIVVTLAALIVLCLTYTEKQNAVAQSADQQQPNIVYILADDLGYGDIGSYGQKKIKTPNLDRMAAEGIRFTQHYAGSTVCAPSRSVLMTGLHTGHTPVRGNRGIQPIGQ